MTEFVKHRVSVHTIADEAFRRAELGNEVIEVVERRGTYATGKLVGACETAAGTRFVPILCKTFACHLNWVERCERWADSSRVELIEPKPTGGSTHPWN
jgi:hypothetical protein